MYPDEGMERNRTSCPALVIVNLFVLIARAEPTLTENRMALPQTVAFKAETVDEEGIWYPCIVKDISKDSVIISFDGQNVDWNRCTCDPRVRRPSTNNVAIR